MVAAGWLWPFAGQPHPRNEALPFEPRGGPYPGELGDRFLNRMLLEGVGETEALDRYAGLNPKQDLHLDRLIEIQLRRQRRRDLNTGFAVTELIEANFRSQRLFLTQNHPDLFVFRAVARGLFDKLGLSLGEVDFVLKRLRVSPLSAAAAPIHPSIAAHFGIEWAGPTARYPYFGEGSFTFEQYVRRYMRFEWNSELHQALGTPLSNASASVLETLNRGLAISPGSAQGFRRKAAVLSRLGRGVEATEAALCAIELEPDAPAGHVALVSVYLHRNCLAEAEIVARRAIALDPDHAPAHQLLAESLRRTAKTTWALHMDRRAQFWPSPLP
jgi:tetratricopeptide (TPR) repeat protein